MDSMKYTKLIFNFLFIICLTSKIDAQEKMSFQSVIRNSQGKLIVNKKIGIKLSIIRSISSVFQDVYVERHEAITNVNGLLTLKIGTGNVVFGDLNLINWNDGDYFLKTELDLEGGTNYSIVGQTEFTTVPTAIMSKYSDTTNYSKHSTYSDTANFLTILNRGTEIGAMNYWNGSSWISIKKGLQNQSLKFCDGKPTWIDGNVCPGTILEINTINDLGTLTIGTAASGVSSSISYLGGNGGPYPIQTVSSVGVVGLTATILAGSFVNGSGALTVSITGKPLFSQIGYNALFKFVVGGISFTLARKVNFPAGTVGAITCSNLNSTGTLDQSFQATDVTNSISYTTGNGGVYSNLTFPSSGVLGLNAKINSGYLTNATGTINVQITGTPQTGGIANFQITLGGKTCTLSRTVNPVATVSGLDCSSTSAIITTSPLPSSVQNVISYTGGTTGRYPSMEIPSTGLTGLKAVLEEGRLASGNGSIVVKIIGEPLSSGVANFEFNFGGKTCTFSRTVQLPSVTVGSLNCSLITIKGSHAVNLPINAKVEIPYDNGNGGSYLSQTFVSSGVTGLTANLPLGKANTGSGLFTLELSGTTSKSGNALFSVTIAGKTCPITVFVQPITGLGTTLKDIENNEYETVYIGTQQWMKENLKTTKYNDGTPLLPFTPDPDGCDKESSWLTSGIYVKHPINNHPKIGNYYNVVSITSSKNICPIGWRVPLRSDYEALVSYLGGFELAASKLRGSALWDVTTSEGSSLFSAFGVSNISVIPQPPSDVCIYFKADNFFISDFGLSASFWLKNEGFTEHISIPPMSSVEHITFDSMPMETGHSIRCIKD
ncbi:MAG: hypothetical protein EB100_03920 [Crocinitomicaceae bacterium]|nr:hypothetical protein [Crocinitomicaceae bacterium]